MSLGGTIGIQIKDIKNLIGATSRTQSKVSQDRGRTEGA
jgi:hypothetical protein